MPHVRATEGNRFVDVDNNVTVTRLGAVNIDITLPLVAAAITAGKIEVLDSATAPVRTTDHLYPH